MDSFSFRNAKFVSGIADYTYQEVLEDFDNSDFIGIITFNISRAQNGYLISRLKNACNNGATATVITNIPKRFGQYFGNNYALAAKKIIDDYIRILKSEAYWMRLSAYFDFSNHSKIIMTNNIAYVGSSNYSDESKNNYESGVICRDSEFIRYLKHEVFQSRIAEAITYYKYNIAEAVTIFKKCW